MSASALNSNTHPSPYVSSSHSASHGHRDVPAFADDSHVDGNDGTINETDDNFLCSEVYLGLIWHGGQLGVAHYDLSSMQIHVMHDAFETDDFTLTKQIVRETQPSAIIVSSIQDGRLIQCLRKLVSDNNLQSPRSRSEAARIEYLPSSDFNYEVSKRRILSMKLPSIPQHLTDRERSLHFASILPLDQINMVRAVGGLCKYLERSRVGVELEDAVTPVPILGFRAFTLENQILIDPITYMALNIFDTEIHPSVYKFGGGSGKEGLSLFGILNRCKSSIGSRMLRQWFLRPVKNAALLNQRHDAVAFFISPRNRDVVDCLQGCLKHIKYLPKVLWRMSKAQATCSDLVALSKTIYHAVYIGNIARAQPQNIEIFRKIAATFTDDLHSCANLIHRTIDFEESKRLNKFVVKPNIDEDLDKKKRLFHGVPDILYRVAQEEIKSLNEEIRECKASYLPQVGYLLVIDMPEGKSEGDDHTIDGLQFIFASNDQLYYKSARTRELDDKMGDIQQSISDMEVNILHRLQSAILERTQVLLSVMEITAELDCLMSLATCAAEFGYTQPKLVQESVIDIKGGRHPLQELCCSPYVPNPTAVGGRYARIQLLTGPNACGKSVYLKQVALIVFMSHIGSFVPAEHAHVGPVDQFFSRIKSSESVSSGMSTFMQDSMQVSRALAGATQNSLVIVDEFGKGTESTDGLSLLTAVIKFWISKGQASPYVFVSTHYHSMIHQKLLPSTPLVQFMTLDTIMNGTELVFLYQLKEGHASSSYACQIAAQVGVPQPIIKRGQEVSELLSQYKDVPHIKNGGSEEQHKRHQHIVDKFMRLDIDKDDLISFLKSTVLQPQQTPKTFAVPKDKVQHQRPQEQITVQKQKKTEIHQVKADKGTSGKEGSKQPAEVVIIDVDDEIVDKQKANKTKKVSPLLRGDIGHQSIQSLLQKKRAAMCTMNGRVLGPAIEQFIKTPLLGQSEARKRLSSNGDMSSHHVDLHRKNFPVTESSFSADSSSTPGNDVRRTGPAVTELRSTFNNQVLQSNVQNRDLSTTDSSPNKTVQYHGCLNRNSDAKTQSVMRLKNVDDMNTYTPRSSSCNTTFLQKASLALKESNTVSNLHFQHRSKRRREYTTDTSLDKMPLLELPIKRKISSDNRSSSSEAIFEARSRNSGNMVDIESQNKVSKLMPVRRSMSDMSSSTTHLLTSERKGPAETSSSSSTTPMLGRLGQSSLNTSSNLNDRSRGGYANSYTGSTSSSQDHVEGELD